MTHKAWRKTGSACVFCNGDLKNPDRVRRLASSCDLLLAADGGANHFVRLNLKPQVIIGDMDSISSDPWSGNEDLVRIPHSPNKAKSDAELAVEYVFQQGYRQVTLIAAGGGRFDHTLGNVALAAQYPGRVAIVDSDWTLVAVDNSQKCRLQGPIGTTVSLIPYGQGVTRVRTTGLKYSLQNEELANATHGLSNERIETQSYVSVSEGIVLVYIESEEVWPLQ